MYMDVSSVGIEIAHGGALSVPNHDLPFKTIFKSWPIRSSNDVC